VAFLASCPDCGQFQVCVLSQEARPRLRCARCRAVYPSVLVGKELELATTLVEGDFEPSGGTATLVVVQNLPSVYPRRRRKRRKARRRVVVRAVTVPPSPVVYPVAEPAIAALLEPVIEPLPVPIVESLPQPVLEPPPPIISDRPAVPRARPKPVRRPADDEELEYGRFQLNGLSVFALFVVATALMAASIGFATGLVRPLAGVGVTLGLVAVVTSGLSGRRLLLPVALTAISVALFVVSFAAPGVLGPTYTRSRESGPDAAEVQVVPHLPFAADVGLRSAEWVDASKAALQQGGTKVEIVEVRIERTPLDGQYSLMVRVRLQQQTAIITSPGWKDEAQATLRDAAGNVHERRSASTPAGKAASQQVGVGVSVSDKVLAFIVPAGARGPFRLELTGAAWGGAGTFKFEIPSTMVKR
jgi:hypothetical protein